MWATKTDPTFLESYYWRSHQLAYDVEHTFELPVVFPSRSNGLIRRRKSPSDRTVDTGENEVADDGGIPATTNWNRAPSMHSK